MITKILFGVFVTAALLFGVWFFHPSPLRDAGRYGGMSMSQVRSLAGSPASVVTQSDGSVHWTYSSWWNGSLHIFFATNGIAYLTMH